MSYEYLKPRLATNPYVLPAIEVFWVTEEQAELSQDRFSTLGWYWWCCFPGCLPDGEAEGPFATHALALHDARKSMQ